jgi:hypothetical protein
MPRAATVRAVPTAGSVMRPAHVRMSLVLTFSLLGTAALSCRGVRTTTRPYHEPPPPGLAPTVLDYVETDAFDALFESALTNQDPVILVQTATSQPDWGPRLNAWIAAWNRGGKVVDGPRGRVRMQAPVVPSAVNAETLHEFRLLVDDLMTRVEDVARRGSSWWAEERTQRRRIDLLKPYSLRFHLDDDKKIQLVLFNGMYSRYYRQFMESMSMRDADEPEEWTRTMKCSLCRRLVRGVTAQRTRVRSAEDEEQHPGE